jgi:molecular chaperone GrpE
MSSKSETVTEELESVDSATSAENSGDAPSTSPGGVGAEEGQTEAAIEELEKAKIELAQLGDRFLRQAADFQNFRKRAIEERAISVEIGRSQVALPTVDVLDDLRRSLEAAEKAAEDDENSDSSVDALLNGVRLVYGKLEAELAKLGIKAMEVVDQPFNEAYHDAMMQQPAPEGVEPGTILAEVQKGYLIGDRVLRHAQVVVAT